MTTKEKLKKFAIGLIRDLIIAGLIVTLIMAVLFIYSGIWPPIVVIESGSMQHSNTESFIGVIDTGDLVLVKKEPLSNIKTYVEGRATGYSTYGNYGDVIIFHKNGDSSKTPIIHRALIYLKYDPSKNTYYSEELKNLQYGEEWSRSDGINSPYDLNGTLYIYNYGHTSLTITIDLQALLADTRNRHDGYITLGDNNKDVYDQRARGTEPIKYEWLIGVARGEIPWFGLLKLSFGSPEERRHAQLAPANSWTSLYIALFLIIVGPLLIDYTLNYIRKNRKKTKPKIIGEIKYDSPPMSYDSRVLTPEPLCVNCGKPLPERPGAKIIVCKICGAPNGWTK